MGGYAMQSLSYKLTVITATYNSESTLEQTISSVINQDYANFEYIIIDGGSTDGTIEIIKRYEKKGIKWISEPDDGLYDALNKGINMALGDYFFVLGSDDALYNESIISKIMSQIDDSIDILSGSVIVVDEGSRKWYLATNNHAREKNIYKGGMIPHQGMITKTCLGKKYPFDKTYEIVADYKFFLQCYYDNKVKIKYIDDVVAFYSNGGVSSNNDERFILECNRLYDELGLPFCDSFVNSKSSIKRFIKLILKKIGALMYAIIIMKKIKYTINTRFIWKKHKCNNIICRWCGRI